MSSTPAATPKPAPAAPKQAQKGETKSDEKEKGKDVRRSNIIAAKSKKKKRLLESFRGNCKI